MDPYGRIKGTPHIHPITVNVIHIRWHAFKFSNVKLRNDLTIEKVSRRKLYEIEPGFRKPMKQ